MPKYLSNSVKRQKNNTQTSYFQNDAFNAYYYFWLIKACKLAVSLEKENKEFDKRYIATALYEVLKFTNATLRKINFYVCNINKDGTYSYANQYKGAASLFGESFPFLNENQCKDIAMLLLKLIHESEFGIDIIADLHDEKSELSISYVLFSILSYKNIINRKQNIFIIDSNNLLFVNQDTDIPMFLEQYKNDPCCSMIYHRYKFNLETEWLNRRIAVIDEKRKATKENKKLFVLHLFLFFSSFYLLYRFAFHGYLLSFIFSAINFYCNRKMILCTDYIFTTKRIYRLEKYINPCVLLTVTQIVAIYLFVSVQIKVSLIRHIVKIFLFFIYFVSLGRVDDGKENSAKVAQEELNSLINSKNEYTLESIFNIIS